MKMKYDVEAIRGNIFSGKIKGDVAKQKQLEVEYH
jgi:hypothetical protein